MYQTNLQEGNMLHRIASALKRYKKQFEIDLMWYYHDIINNYITNRYIFIIKYK